jgi:hypothetical protein
VLTEICRGTNLELGENIHGQIVASRETPDAEDLVKWTFTDQEDLEVVSTEREQSRYMNKLEYRCAYRYAAQPWPNQPWDSKLSLLHPWSSGLLITENLDAQDQVGKVVIGTLDNYVVRDHNVSSDVAQRLRASSEGPPPAYDGSRKLTVTGGWHLLAPDPDDPTVVIDLGSYIEIESEDAFSENPQLLLVRAVEVDALNARVTFDGRVVNPPVVTSSSISPSVSGSVSPSSSVSPSTSASSSPSRSPSPSIGPNLFFSGQIPELSDEDGSGPATFHAHTGPSPLRVGEGATNIGLVVVVMTTSDGDVTFDELEYGFGTPHGVNFVDIPEVGSRIVIPGVGDIRLYFLDAIPYQSNIVYYYGPDAGHEVIVYTYMVGSTGPLTITGLQSAQTTGTLTPADVDDGSPGGDSWRFGFINTVHTASDLTPHSSSMDDWINNADSSERDMDLDHSLHAEGSICSAVMEIAPGTGSRQVGWTSVGSAKYGALYFAVSGDLVNPPGNEV